MMQADSRGDSDQPQLFDRRTFRKIALRALTGLRDLVQERLVSDSLEKLQMKSVWDEKLPSFENNALSVLFDEFAPIDESFDFRKTRQELCTLDNLSQLVKTCGPRRLTRTFQEFFESRAFQEWKILIPLENVRAKKDFLRVKGESVELRWLTREERDQLKELFPENKFNDLYFSVTQQAGDMESAVFQARERIRQFLAPYYLHRVRNPDRWWRVRTIRQIVSPLTLFLGPANLPGAKMELWQVPTEASDLFAPEPGIDPDWKSTVEELVSTWSMPKLSSDSIGERLQLCSRWMFSAESDELPENAFLKHAIAWEALLPNKADRLFRCWYLLLLCLGASDRLCVKTVSQASCLVDRRNSFAHPEIAATLYGSVEKDLTKLQQSVWWAFDNTLLVWQSPAGRTIDWSQVLSSCYSAILSDDVPVDYDDSALLLLDSLGYIERDENGAAILSREGHCLRVEARITRARELWSDNKNPHESVGLIACALQIAADEALPPYKYHSLLTLKDRNDSLDRNVFEKGWRAAMPGNAPPTKDEIISKLNDIEREFGVSPDLVGWKR